MAHINSSTPIPAVVGSVVPVHSFGHEYQATIVSVAPRTMVVRYTNKSGKVWELKVKRNDIAAPTEKAKAATAQGVKTRTLRSAVRSKEWQIKHAAERAMETLDSINAKRAESRATAEGYGWKLQRWDLPMTEAEYEFEMPNRVEILACAAHDLENAKAELAAHLAAIAK